MGNTLLQSHVHNCPLKFAGVPQLTLTPAFSQVLMDRALQTWGVDQGWAANIWVISLYHGAVLRSGAIRMTYSCSCLTLQQRENETKRGKSIKQPPWPRHVCKCVNPQGWIVLRHQGESEWAVGVVLSGKHVHFCFLKCVPNMLDHLRGAAPSCLPEGCLST